MGDRNFIANPSIERSTVNWAALNSALLRSSTQSEKGSFALKVTIDNTGVTLDGTKYAVTLSSNTTYTVSAYIWIDSAAVSIVQVDMDRILFAGATGATGTSATTVGGWQRISFQFATVGDAIGEIHFTTNAHDLDDVFRVDGFCIEEAALTDYIDGSQGEGYAWDGRPFLSTSHRFGETIGPVLLLEDVDGNILYNFLNGDDPLFLVDGSMNESQMSDGRVIETFTLTGKDATNRTLSDSLVELQELLADAVEWQADPLKRVSYWLRFMIRGESIKRALIYNYSLPLVADRFIDKMLIPSVLQVPVAITRHKAWENPTVQTTSVAGGSWLGATWSIPAPGGDLDARIMMFLWRQDSVNVMERCWIGIRPENYGLTNFSPILECETSSVSSADVVTTADATASGGSYEQIQFSTGGGIDAMSNRTASFLSTMVGAGNEPDFVGKYMLLLRYRCAAATTIGIQLATSWGNSITPSTMTLGATQYVTGTGGNWRMLPMGLMDLPMSGYRESFQTAIGDLGKFTLHIRAERYTGVGFLACDCWVLMPSAHMTYIDGTIINQNEWPQIHMDENDIPSYYTKDSLAGGNIIATPNPDVTKWACPKEGGTLVFVGEQAADQVIADTVSNFRIDLMSRYANYRND